MQWPNACGERRETSTVGLILSRFDSELDDQRNWDGSIVAPLLRWCRPTERICGGADPAEGCSRARGGWSGFGCQQQGVR